MSLDIIGDKISIDHCLLNYKASVPTNTFTEYDSVNNLLPNMIRAKTLQNIVEDRGRSWEILKDREKSYLGKNFS